MEHIKHEISQLNREIEILKYEISLLDRFILIVIMIVVAAIAQW